MTELDQLFRYTALFLLDELLSPVVTPLVLIFGLSHRTQVSSNLCFGFGIFLYCC